MAPLAIAIVAHALAGAALPAAPVTSVAEAGRSIPARLETCAARLDSERDIGLGRVLAACPEIESSFADAALRPWLPADWREHAEDLSAGSLRELAALLREGRRASASAPPDRALLAEILAENAGQAGDEASLWRRFLRWLRASVGLDAVPPEAPPSDGPLASGRAAAFWTVLGYVAFAFSMAFALWIVRGELRAFVSSRRRAAAPEPSPDVPAVRAVAALEHAAPLAERPGLLLRRLTALLAGRPGLLRIEAWTVPELLAARPFADGERMAQLAQLARVAEAVRYSPAAPDAARLREATLAGEALVRALEESSP